MKEDEEKDYDEKEGSGAAIGITLLIGIILLVSGAGYLVNNLIGLLL